jgi:hypothetical protein
MPQGAFNWAMPTHPQMMPMMGGFPGMDQFGAAMMPQVPKAAPPASATAGKVGTRFKKAPDAPKRFKSAFIIFSAEKHKQIKEALANEGRTEKTTDIAKLVSEAWREMPPAEREAWEEKARQDKARYEMEKSMYKGPWKIPANKRTPKDPSAPKRPMSAFLAFSNKRRAALKRQHPDATNADLSKMLSKTWKEAPLDQKSKYMEEEAELRAKYKVEMGKWRKRVAEEKKTERRDREALAMQAVEARANDPNAGKNPLMAPAMASQQFAPQGMQFGYAMPQGMNNGQMFMPNQMMMMNPNMMQHPMGGYQQGGDIMKTAEA